VIGRSQFDNDDEVRDRATFYLNVLNEQQKAMNLTYIINGVHHVTSHSCLGCAVLSGCVSLISIANCRQHCVKRMQQYLLLSGGDC